MAANSRTAVATHLMASLAIKDDLVTSSYLASSVNTHAVVVRRLLGDLQKAGLVETVAGKSGGARLAKKANQISLRDIYDAVDEGSVFALNTNEPNRKCPVSCVMKEVLGPIFSGVDDQLARQLERTRLSEVVEEIKSRAKL